MHKGVWHLEEPPAGTKIIDGMWVYDIKVDGDGNFVKPKAWWVAHGDRMRYDIDYGETWAMVARMESVRIVMAIAVVKGLATRQWDFSSAYLNGYQEHDVWMQQPPGFIKSGEEHIACKLVKALYGTPDAGHMWYKTLCKGYQDCGFHESKANPCVRIRQTKSSYTITTTHTDNVFAGSSSENAIELIKEEFQKMWDLEGVDDRELLLGITVRKLETGDMWLTQGPYFEKVL
jgi:hypothetical protein